ncbi:hypothetical protein LCGC14_3132470, partial [marine sediment metagenome]
DGICLDGGVEIKEGVICATRLEIFNITSVNVTKQNVTILEDFIVVGNLTLGQKITFAFNEVIDNIVDGWITITGNLNVTGTIYAGDIFGFLRDDGDTATGNYTFQDNVTILGTLFGGSPVKISGGLNVTGNLNAIDNLTIFEYFFLDSDYSIPPGPSKILRRDSATKAVFGVQNIIADASSDTGVGYVLNTSVGEYRIDLHSALDTQNPNDTVHHLLGANNREIWRLNSNSDSSFSFESGLDSEIVMINRTGLFVTGDLNLTGNISLPFGDLVSEQNPDAVDAIRIKASGSDVDVVLGGVTDLFSVWNAADTTPVFFVNNVGNTDVLGDLTIGDDIFMS